MKTNNLQGGNSPFFSSRSFLEEAGSYPLKIGLNGIYGHIIPIIITIYGINKLTTLANSLIFLSKYVNNQGQKVIVKISQNKGKNVISISRAILIGRSVLITHYMDTGRQR